MGHSAPVGMHQEHFKRIARGNSEDKHHDQLFQPTEAVEFHDQHQEDHNGGDERGRKQRDVEKQVKAEGRAQKLSQIGSQSSQLGGNPQPEIYFGRKIFATVLRERFSGGNAQLGGEI